MLESIVSSFLNRFLGDYFENFSSENLNVGILSGIATVENLHMTSTALQTMLNAPLKVTDGKLRKLHLQIPWTDLKNNSTVMKLEGLSIVAEVTDHIEFSEADELKYKQYLLETIESKREAKALAQAAGAQNADSDTYSDAYIDRILRNLQIEISGITVDIHDSKLKTKFGFYLSSLNLQTANESWKVESMSNIQSSPQNTRLPCYKIAHLDNLGIYISANDSCTIDHVLEPLKVSAQVQHRLHASAEEEKGHAELSIETLKLKLTRAQFKFVARLFEKMERIKRKARFVKFRPKESVSENPSAWWNFAFKTVKQQYDIDQKVELFNRQYIQKYCIWRSEYRKIYEKKLKNEHFSEKCLDQLESDLDISSLIEIREAVKLKMRQKPKSTGWFGGWFGGGGSGGSSTSVQDDLEISLEDKKRLQQLVEDNENIVVAGENQPGITKHSLHISLPLLCIEVDEYLSVQFHDSIINYNSIPGSKASSFELVTQKFEVHNLQDTSDQIITSQKKSESDVFFKMLFQINPFDPRNMTKIADQSIDVVSGGVDININHKLFKDVQRAFRVPEEANLIEFSTALQHEYVQRYAQTRAGLTHIVSTRNIFLIRLDMNAPRIKIPGFGEEAIVMNFGRLEIETNKSKIHSTLEFDQSKLEIDELESMAYANYDVKLENLEIQVLKSSNDTDLDLSRHVLEPLSINWRLERLDTKAQSTADLPKYKVQGEIESLKFDLSNYRVVQALTVFEYANSVWSEPINLDDFTPTTSELLVLPTAPAYVPSARSNVQLDLVDSVYLFDTNLFTIDETPSDESFYDAKDTLSGSNVIVSETASKYSASSALDAIQVAIRMKIHKVEASVYDEVSDNLASQSRILLLETGVLQFSQKVRKYQNEIKGFCHSVTLIYRPDEKLERMTLIESGAKKTIEISNNDKNILQIPGVPMRRNKSAIEMENSAIWFELLEDRRVDITESDLIVNTAAFESSIDTVCIGKIMRFLNSMKPKRASISIEQDESSEISTDESQSSSSSSLNPVNVKNITIKSKSAKLNLLSYYRTVSIFEMSGTEIGFCIKKKENIIRLKVAKVSLEDPNKPHPYCHVISVADTSATFFELEMKLFDLTKEENEDLNLFNGEIIMRAGALNINFFYVFMDHLAFKYPEELQEAFSSFDEFDTYRQNTSVVQKTTDKYENPTRYKLDVRMDAPKIFIPESPLSNVGLKADLGSLVVDNTVTNYVTSNSNLRSLPVKDTVIVKLTDFRLIKIANSEKPSDPENVEIFNQKSLTIKVERNLSLKWFFDAPSMALFFEIPSISMTLGKADLEIFWKTLYGNLMGRFSKVEFMSHVPPNSEAGCMSLMGKDLNFDHSPTETGRITVTAPDGITINLPGVSAGGNSVDTDSDVPTIPSRASQLTDVDQPDDFDIMIVNFKMSEVKLTIYRDSIHSSELAQATMSGLKGNYCIQNNQEMTVYLSINDLLTSDTRLEKPSSVPTYLVQKQADENQELMNLTYSSFPQGEDRSKQIISQKIQSMQIILILDLVSQIYDIFVGSMPTNTTQKRSYGADIGTEFVNRISSTLSESDSKSHLQFYLEMQKPNILMVDLTKREPSVIKIQTEIKMNYIASMQEQNLDLSILDTEVSCVPFKWCFNADSIHYGQIVIDGIDLDLSTQFSKEYTRGRLKMSDFEIILTPAVVSTILLAYQYLLSGDENVESSSSKSSETVYVPIGCQNVVDPTKIWFLPNPTGSNVDSAVPCEAEKEAEKENEDHEEQFTIEIPNASIKFETRAFYGRSANTVSLPLLLFRTKGNIEVQNWSSEMKADLNMKLIGDVFHEARPGYEKLIEPLEYSTARSEEDFQWFEMECHYRNYNRSIKQHISDFGEDDFEHTEKLPKQKLSLSTSNSFNLNISSETIHVFNHWQSSFSESFTELEKTSSLTNQKPPTPQHSSTSNSKSIDPEMKAPITIYNMTDHDIILKPSSNWKDFDPTIARGGGISPKSSNQLYPGRERRANVLCNQSSLLLPAELNAQNSADSVLYNLGSVPLHFQISNPNHRRSVYKTNFYRIEQQIISICPNGFTKRQIDVSSPSEIPVEFVSNTNPNLRITLIVHVEGIAGVRKISIRTNISIVNQLPLPLEISSMADSTLAGSLAEFSLDPTKSFFIPDSDELEIKRGKNISVPISVLNQSFKFAVKLADPNISTSLKPIDYSRFYSKNYNGEPIIERLEFNTKDQSGLKYYANIVINASKLTRSSGKSATFAKIEISVKPCFAVRNWLPFPISIQVFGGTEMYEIDSGRSVPILRSKADAQLHVEYSYFGESLQSENVKISSSKETKDDISLFKFYSSNKKSNQSISYLRKKIIWSPNQSRLEVFAPYWIVNKTNLILSYHVTGTVGQDEQNFQHCPDDNFRILPIRRNEMAISCMKSGKSDKVTLNTIGHQGTIFCPPFQGRNSENQSYLLGSDVTSTTFGLTSIITIQPFYKLINRTESDIEIAEYLLSPDGKQVLTPEYHWIRVKANSSSTFWPSRNATKLIRCRIPKTNFISQPIKYEDNDQGILLHLGDVTGLFAEVSNTDNECKISFSPYFNGSAAFNIINLSGYDISFKQKEVSRYSKLQPCNSILYTWTNPVDSRELILEVEQASTRLSSNSLTMSRLSSFTGGISNSSFKQVTRVTIPESGADALKVETIRLTDAEIFVIPVFIGAQRTIVITQDRAHKKMLTESDRQVTDMDISLKIKAITISLLDYVRRREVAALHILGTGTMWHMQKPGQQKWRELDDRIAKMAEDHYRAKRSHPFRAGDYTVDTNRMQMTKRSDGRSWSLNRAERGAIQLNYEVKSSHATLDIMIQNIQLDNCLKHRQWPVILAKIPQEQTVAAQDVYERELVRIQIIWGSSTERNMKRYRKFYILIQEFFLKIDIDFAMSLSRVFEDNQTYSNRFGESEIFRLFKDDIEFVDQTLVENKDQNVISAISFFEHIHLSPLKIHFKFSLESDDEELARSNTIIQLMKSLGLSIVTKGEVDFRLAYFEDSYRYFSNNELQDAIWRHYKFQIVQQMYKFVYGLELFGNPVKVAFDWGSGVKNLFYEPYQGMTQSGDEFLEGIRIGGNKFFSGVVGGTAGGLNKITHNLGSVAATVSFDREFLDKRQRDNINAPSGIKEGLLRGGENLATGIFGGITGIVTKPVQGAQKEGVGGFFKGIGKGLAGVVARPIAGVVDATSNTFAGIHNELDTKAEIGQQRRPRVMDENPLQVYKERLAHAQDILWQLETDEKNDIAASLSSVSVHKTIDFDIPLAYAITSNKRFVVIVTNFHVMLIDTRTALGRLNVEWIKPILPTTHFTYGGQTARGSNEQILEVKDKINKRNARFSSGSELKLVKDAVRLAVEQASTREEFDSLV